MAKILQIILSIQLLLSSIINAFCEEGTKPNVILIITDEHNLRTIGKYRELLTAATGSTDQAFVWGEDAKVDTTYIDSLADTGATFSNFHTVSPLCTTSRGALMTGTYPSTNGAIGNHVPMNADAKTFANVLQTDLGYSTAYMGKWHLNGKAKGKNNFGSPEGRSFGFNNTSLLFNRGHHKFINEWNGIYTGFSYSKGAEKFQQNTTELNEHYTTDFLTSKAIEYIKSQKALGNPFALTVSYPDPHAPKEVRPPYDTMFNDTKFDFPITGKAALRKDPAIPSWSFKDPKYRSIDVADADEKIAEIEASERFRKSMIKSFGMIKLIDDSLGRILKTLNDEGIRNNTIIVFTSDHGDFMSEHANNGKILPYKSSAGVPFIISWPKKIQPKVIHTVYSSVDFVPTLLNLVGAQDVDGMGFQGVDASEDILSDVALVSDDSRTIFIDGPNGRYASAVTQKYKLVLNKKGTPWLFDMQEDPDELYNYYNENEEYVKISSEMQNELVKKLKQFEFGLSKKKVPVYLDKPACLETQNILGTGFPPFSTCSDITVTTGEDEEGLCSGEKYQEKCPVTCKTCTEDSQGKMMMKKKVIKCSTRVSKNPDRLCKKKYVRLFCPTTCLDFPSKVDQPREIDKNRTTSENANETHFSIFAGN